MEVKIEKLDHFGRGITRINEKICFVENALPDELVEIEIINNRKKYIEAKTNKIIKESKCRNKNTCPYYIRCGGCNLEHLSYEEENIYKENKVKELVSRFALIDKDLVKNIIYSNEYNYRNKITLHVDNKKLGLYEINSNVLVEIDNCKLVNNKINELISFLKELIKVNDIEEIVIRTSNDLENVSVKLVGIIKDYSILQDKVDVLQINEEVVTDKKYLDTSIGKVKYKVSVDSFYQVNPDITVNIYDKVKEVLKNTNSKNILDLYCGAGTIGLYCNDVVDSIVGVDYNKNSIENANINKELNNIENAKYICSKVEDVIDSFKDKFDCIIVDPPRSGLDDKTISYLLEMNSKNIIYISCDPVTLSRDLKDLKEEFNIIEIIPYNMFPRTYHVETLVILEKN